jgi:hypothetical protein
MNRWLVRLARVSLVISIATWLEITWPWQRDKGGKHASVSFWRRSGRCIL